MIAQGLRRTLRPLDFFGDSAIAREIYRREDASIKKDDDGDILDSGCEQSRPVWTLEFAEFGGVYQMEADFKKKMETEFAKMIDSVAFAKRENGK